KYNFIEKIIYINIKEVILMAMHSTGEKPGTGTYTCTMCAQKVVLDDKTDKLPPCPKCQNTNYSK
ncbi:zinc ribbon-containing protein, partial [Listeria monocytogenes]